MGYNYTKALVLTGAAAAAAWFVYYLLQDDGQEDEYDLYKKDYSTSDTTSASSVVEKMTRNDVLDLLAKIAASQEKAKTLLQKLVKEIIGNGFNESMEDLYNRVVKDVPVDPLKARGLTLFDLDYLVERYQNDPAVRAHIMTMINLPMAEEQDDERDIAPDEIVSVYEFMLKELQELQNNQQPLTSQPNLNTNAASIAVQAIIAAKVQNKFGYTSVQIDRAITKHQGELGMNTKFARFAMQIQSEMTEITG
ncbi:apicomplexa specific secreted signal peptide [Babesia ovis]|uniref:Apicomplexa specific secreted signal peptide n=1 Tax=Babesia ovis TaxID=5869 RepID=A0A9W5T992_BABOV|nr:apicomplexa specific secreted signal peptide [Babesia ovis]